MVLAQHINQKQSRKFSSLVLVFKANSIHDKFFESLIIDEYKYFARTENFACITDKYFIAADIIVNNFHCT